MREKLEHSQRNLTSVEREIPGFKPKQGERGVPDETHVAHVESDGIEGVESKETKFGWPGPRMPPTFD